LISVPCMALLRDVGITLQDILYSLLRAPDASPITSTNPSNENPVTVSMLRSKHVGKYVLMFVLVSWKCSLQHTHMPAVSLPRCCFTVSNVMHVRHFRLPKWWY
jgi:hypothetical protein